jgi:polynucleotide 5'-kinase involved in rRNA processing
MTRVKPGRCGALSSADVSPLDQARQPLRHKRILVCGKGGGGKSTLVAWLASALEQKGYPVVVLAILDPTRESVSIAR